ncbi:MAG: hypothetical protein RMJ84_11210 [Sandaracinaceae bacterium]|nr:hypothetical protein [Sandaracinaceae bacterium]
MRGVKLGQIPQVIFLLTVGIGVGLIGDHYFRHGLSVSYFQRTQLGERLLVLRTVEHRTEFPNTYRPLARYVENWPFEKLGISADVPPIDMDVEARLWVAPSEAPCYLRGRVGERWVDVEVDGREHPKEGVGAGWHRIRSRWESPSGVASSFRFEWGGGPDFSSPIPRERLFPVDTNWPVGRVGWWVGVWVITILFTILVWRALSAQITGERKRRWGQVATLGIVLWGTGLRLFDYDVMPEYRENGDELFAMWNGWSILNQGKSRGWSLWPSVYGNAVDIEHVRIFGTEWYVISPYFEHPPGLHLLAGMVCTIGGAKDWKEVRLRYGRIVPIALSAISIWLIVAIGRMLEPRGPGPWLAALLFASLPMIALQTRVIKEEALVTPLGLGMVHFFLKWRDEGRKAKHLLISALCAGATTLAKVTGYAFVISLFVLVCAQSEWKKAFYAFGIGTLISSLFPIWGALVDWNVFTMTMAQQSTRPMHWNIFLRWFDDALINHSVVGRGWIIFLWIGTLWTLPGRGWKNSMVITVPFLLYMIAISIGSGNWTFGWYAVPLYPFLCLGAGRWIWELWRKPDMFKGAMFTLICVFYALNFTVDVHWAKQPASWPLLRQIVTLTVALFMTPYTISQIWPERKNFARFALGVGLGMLLFISALFVVKYDVFYDAYRNFDRDAYFDR